MNITELRLELLDEIMYMYEQQLLDLQHWFAKEKEPILTVEQHNELMKRVKAHQNDDSKHLTFEEFKAEMKQRFG